MIIKSKELIQKHYSRFCIFFKFFFKSYIDTVNNFFNYIFWTNFYLQIFLFILIKLTEGSASDESCSIAIAINYCNYNTNIFDRYISVFIHISIFIEKEKSFKYKIESFYSEVFLKNSLNKSFSMGNRIESVFLPFRFDVADFNDENLKNLFQ